MDEKVKTTLCGGVLILAAALAALGFLGAGGDNLFAHAVGTCMEYVGIA